MSTVLKDLPEQILNPNPAGDKDYRIRAMTLSDLPELMEIESASYQFPWTEGIFKDCLRVGYYCQLIEHQGKIMAYGILSIGAGEAHVLNLCVAPTVRKQGVGKKMLGVLLNQARYAGVGVVLLEVRPSNQAAIKLYQCLGFNEIGRRKNYYPSRYGREDALMYARSL